MVQDIKITPTPISYSGSVATATGEPQLLFRGSGASATDIELNVQSNSDLSFQGTQGELFSICLLYTSPSPRDATLSRMPSSA